MCCTKRREENRKRMGRDGKMLAGVALDTHKMKGMEGWNGEIMVDTRKRGHTNGKGKGLVLVAVSSKMREERGE